MPTYGSLSIMRYIYHSRMIRHMHYGSLNLSQNIQQKYVFKKLFWKGKQVKLSSLNVTLRYFWKFHFLQCKLVAEAAVLKFSLGRKQGADKKETAGRFRPHPPYVVVTLQGGSCCMVTSCFWKRYSSPHFFLSPNISRMQRGWVEYHFYE